MSHLVHITHAQILFFLHSSRDHQDLQSYPTRRSSDLSNRELPSWKREAGWVLTIAYSLQRRCHFLRICPWSLDRKSTRLNSSHVAISYAVFCLKQKIQEHRLDQDSTKVEHISRRHHRA